MNSPPGPEILTNDGRYLYFGGTSYLGLQGHPEVIEAAAAAVQQYGTGNGAGATRAVGRSPLHQRLEAMAARFFGTEDAVCFASGYMASAVGFAGLSEACDHIFVDETAHSSIFDAARLSGKPVAVFSHRNVADLTQKLQLLLGPGEVPLVASDGVFPTLGEVALAGAYLDTIEQYRGLLWLDDAHGVGVLGRNGRGTLEACGIQSESAFFGSSLAKAIGGHGGVIPGTAAFCRRLRRSSRFLQGATGIPLPSAAAALTGLKLLMENPQMRARLCANAKRLKQGLGDLGIELPETPHPIAAFALGNSLCNLEIHERLLERRIIVPYSRYVGAGRDGLLRAVVFSSHTDEQIDQLLAALRELARSSGKAWSTGAVQKRVRAAS